jgi:hypothetical protein
MVHATSILTTAFCSANAVLEPRPKALPSLLDLQNANLRLALCRRASAAPEVLAVAAPLPVLGHGNAEETARQVESADSRTLMKFRCQKLAVVRPSREVESFGRKAGMEGWQSEGYSSVSLSVTSGSASMTRRRKTPQRPDVPVRR